MTAITTKLGQKRLDRCVLAQPKWAKIQEKPGKHAFVTLKIDDLLADTAVRVENAHENGQAPHNTKLLGKRRSTQRSSKMMKLYKKNTIVAFWAATLPLLCCSSVTAQSQYEDWQSLCNRVSQSGMASYSQCTRIIVQAPNSFGVTEWAGDPIGIFWGSTPQNTTIRYRVTHYRSNSSQCGQNRDVLQSDMVNGDVMGMGNTLNLHLINRC